MMEQQLVDTGSQNQFILQALMECRGILGLHPAVPADATICAKVWDQCVRRFRGNMEGAGAADSLALLPWAAEGTAAELIDAMPEVTKAQPAESDRASPDKAKKGKGKK